MTITALVNTDTDEPMKTPITFVLRNTQLVTVRYADPKPVEEFREEEIQVRDNAEEEYSQETGDPAPSYLAAVTENAHAVADQDGNHGSPECAPGKRYH